MAGKRSGAEQGDAAELSKKEQREALKDANDSTMATRRTADGGWEEETEYERAVRVNGEPKKGGE